TSKILTYPGRGRAIFSTLRCQLHRRLQAERSSSASKLPAIHLKILKFCLFLKFYDLVLKFRAQI
ncbi:hypothetical protein, partial [uncultured Campylobacter sp.]|uniref:hypothetical protein n=1 Tax=uncultured Campylobacter sp. TaxID=218934 RepID=UPI00260C5A15